MREKYTKILIKILSLVPLLVVLYFVDQWILPQKEIDDKIVAYSDISMTYSRDRLTKETRKEFVGSKFYTEKGFEFSVQKTFIDENEIKIERSYIFRNVTSVKTLTKDYSSNLISGINGVCLILVITLIVAVVLSLLMLKFYKKLSENGFQNIILINSFLLLITLYFFVMYN